MTTQNYIDLCITILIISGAVFSVVIVFIIIFIAWLWDSGINDEEEYIETFNNSDHD